jgi:hypothetical protein
MKENKNMLTKKEVLENVDDIDFYTLEYSDGVTVVDESWISSSEKSKVFKIETSDAGILYVKFTGYYNSWDGTNWNDAEFVEPKEVYVTQFVKVDTTLTTERVKQAVRELDYEFFSNSSIISSVQQENLGDGNIQFEVFKVPVKDDVLYVKFEGTYASWDSDSSWDEAYFVTQTKIWQTVYEKVDD